MTSPEPLPDHPAVMGKGLLRKIVLFCVNRYFAVQGLKFPPYCSLSNRLDVLRRGVEPDVRRVCDRLLREGMIVVDVGANLGYLTRQFCRRVGHRGKVFAFEPDPFTFRYLEFNTRRYANRQLVQCAVSDNHEPAILHLKSAGTGNSLLDPANSSESISVPCISLDEFLDKAGRPVVDMVKVDVEGAELHVLRGMRETIARLPGLRIIIEYCPKNLLGSTIDPRAVYDEIKAGGFNAQNIRKDGSTQAVDRFESLESLLNPFGYTNLLCAKTA
jgi:FkbM family methyltransferase